MAILSNARWERFAQLVASGESASEAYRQAYGAKGATAGVNGSRLLKDAKVALRVAELRAMGSAANAKSEATTTAEAAERLKTTLLTMRRRREIAREIAEDSKQRASDRIAAVLADAKLAGELVEKPSTTVKVAVNVLTEERRREIMERRKAAMMGGN